MTTATLNSTTANPTDEMSVFSELCKYAEVDSFLEWLMIEIDSIEDLLAMHSLPATRYIDLNSRYQALLEVRDAYCDFKNNIQEA